LFRNGEEEYLALSQLAELSSCLCLYLARHRLCVCLSFVCDQAACFSFCLAVSVEVKLAGQSEPADVHRKGRRLSPLGARLGRA